MNLVAGVDIDRAYTSEEIFDLYHKGRLRAITLEGYCTRLDILENKIRFIPFWESTMFRAEQGTMKTHTFDGEQMRQEVEAEHPIIRRTPQERVAAVALRVLAEAKRSGSVGLTQDQMATIMGESWKQGEPLTGDAIQKLSAWLMNRAEQSNRDADSKRVTRAHMTA